ncbi:MAG: MFS transporter [Pirellulales bacterium]
MLAYLWLMYCAPQVAGPYFAPYVLNDLKFDYTQYMLIFGMSFFAKVVSMPLWGRFAHRYGTRMMLILSGIIIIPLPALWLVSRDLSFLLGLQFVAGFFWGAFELGIVLIFLEAIPIERRTSVLTVYNLGYAVASSVGSIAGGVLLSFLAHNTAAYYWVFAISGVVRLLILPLIAWLPGQTVGDRKRDLQQSLEPDPTFEQPEPLGTALSS